MKARTTTVMTGASSGFGRNAARRLLQDHPEVHLIALARVSHGATLAESLKSESGSDNVTCLPCELGSLESVRAATRSITALTGNHDVPPVTAIVGNAGLNAANRTQTSADGFELTFAVNVLAHVALINDLSGLLAPQSRIVLTTSGSHWGDLTHNRLWGLAPPHWDTVAALAAPGAGPDDPSSAAAGSRAYATSKLAVLYLVHDLARRLRAGTDVYAFNPDFVTGTGLLRDAGRGVRIGMRAITPVLRATGVGISPQQAGDLFAKVIAGPRPGPSGSYIVRNRVTGSSPASYDAERASELWSGALALTSTSTDMPSSFDLKKSEQFPL